MSRARLALYIVGSRTSYKTTEWSEIIYALESKGMLGDTLPLVNSRGEQRNVDSANELFWVCEMEALQGLGNWETST